MANIYDGIGLGSVEILTTIRDKLLGSGIPVPVTRSGNQIVYQQSGYTLQIDGSGFQFFNDIPVFGTVNSLQLQIGPGSPTELNTATIKGLNLSVTELSSLDTEAKVISSIFGGNDLFAGPINAPVNNSFVGGQGNDTMVGGLGDDVELGNQGNDLLLGNQGVDWLVGGQGADSLVGGRDADILIGNEDGDVILGNEDNDQIFGGQGSDTIYGGQGLDTIVGGELDDLLYGNEGADLFGYNLGGREGNDRIVGFDFAGGDRLSLLGARFDFVHNSQNELVITLAEGGSITLVGVAFSSYNPGMII